MHSSVCFPATPLSIAVTGSSRGIGAAAVVRLAEHGADVAITYLSSAQLAEDVANQCRALGVRALVVQGDLSKQENVVKLFEKVMQTFGRLDIVFSNAGIEHWGKPNEVDEAQIDKVVRRDSSTIDPGLAILGVQHQREVAILRRSTGAQVHERQRSSHSHVLVGRSKSNYTRAENNTLISCASRASQDTASMLHRKRPCKAWFAVSPTISARETSP